MHFESPYAFWLLIVIPVVLMIPGLMKTGSAAIRFSSTGNASKTGKSIRQRFSSFPRLLRVLALICIVIALARPQTGIEEVRNISKGIAIEMVVDRSSSMGAEMTFRGSKGTRLDIVKRVFKEFVLGNNGKLDGRPNDLIGMIAFARYPDTICPLTLAHGAYNLFLENLQYIQPVIFFKNKKPVYNPEDGTGIGDALALAAARLRTAEKTLIDQGYNRDKSYEIKSKIIILLSDGENNCGKRTPLHAAELASEWGIKIYTIAFTGEGVITVEDPYLKRKYKDKVPGKVDTTVLKEVADKTGGFFRMANDAKSLQAIYREIDEMEKSEIESVRYVDYKENFIKFALAGLILLVCEIILNCTLFRKIP